MFKGFLIVALTMVAVSSANAQKRNAGLIKGQDARAYGLAGCGLGSVMLGLSRLPLEFGRVRSLFKLPVC